MFNTGENYFIEENRFRKANRFIKCEFCGVKFHPGELNKHRRDKENDKLRLIAKKDGLPPGMMKSLKTAFEGKSHESRCQRQRVVAQLSRGVAIQNLRF